MSIYKACSNGDLNEVILLANKDNLEKEEEGEYGMRPIHIACKKGHYDIVKFLMDKVNMEAETEYGFRPIHFVTQFGHTRIFNLLMNSVDLKARDKYGQTPLHNACRSGMIRMVELLITKNVDLEAEDISFKKPIHNACKYDNTEIVKLLIDGFISDRIYATPPRINLNIIINELLEICMNDEIYYFILDKYDAINSTLFYQVDENYTDIEIFS
jgi:ankyrin repeat protein